MDPRAIEIKYQFCNPFRGVRLAQINTLTAVRARQGDCLAAWGEEVLPEGPGVEEDQLHVVVGLDSEADDQGLRGKTVEHKWKEGLAGNCTQRPRFYVSKPIQGRLL